MEVRPYSIFTSHYMLDNTDLYSDGENDPLIDAAIYADDHLAYDAKGNKLPFSVSCSIFAIEIDRNKHLLEDRIESMKIVGLGTKLAIHVIVFRNMDDKMIYDLNDKVLIDERK